MPEECKESIIVAIYKKGDKTNCSNSNVRLPRCILYDIKQLGMSTLTVEHNYICFLIYRSLKQRHVSASYVVHHQVVVGLTA